MQRKVALAGLSSICILTESGEIVERRIRTQRERFQKQRNRWLKVGAAISDGRKWWRTIQSAGSGG